MSSTRFRRFFWLAWISAAMQGCANEPLAASTAQAPDARLGDLLELLAMQTNGEPVASLLDSQGNAHVIAASQQARTVHHVRISPLGGVERELVRSNVDTNNISAAFDPASRLHLLVNDMHLVREASGWATGSDPPWASRGVAVEDPKLVQARQGFTWAFREDGQQVGVGGRWDWCGFGGAFGAGVIIPWHNASKKLVVVPDALPADQIWHVLDPQDNLDASIAIPMIDDNGQLHVVYHASREGIGARESRYARTAVTAMPGEASVLAAPDKTLALRSFSGSPIPWMVSDNEGMNRAAASVNPVTGSVLIVRAHGASYAMQGGQWQYPQQLPLPHFWEPRLAPAGGNDFHLITTANGRVLYLRYADRVWSSALEIGQATVTKGSIWRTLSIAGNGEHRVFAAWPIASGIVGRWVESAPANQPKPQPATGLHRTFPPQLLAFAKGKAELVTPGVVSGFTEALTAGSHRPQAKILHDSGQWETLATQVISDRYGDNLAWYFLGRAAEGMALCDAAEHYYALSQSLSESVWTRCLGVACQGMKLPEILLERTAAIKAKRAAGECTSY